MGRQQEVPKVFRSRRQRARQRSGGRHLFIGGLVILALVAIPAGWLDSEVVKHAIGALGNQLEKIAGIDRPQSLPTEISRITPPYEPPSEPASPSPLPGARAPAAMPDDSQNTLGPPTKVEEPVIPPGLPAPEPLRNNPAAEAKKAAPAPGGTKNHAGTTKSRAGRHGFVRETATNDIETEVFMAIQNRAIGGVQVSISDNIVRLEVVSPRNDRDTPLKWPPRVFRESALSAIVSQSTKLSSRCKAFIDTRLNKLTADLYQR